MTIQQAVADIDIAAAIASRAIAGKIKIFFIRGQRRGYIPELRINAIPQVLCGAPSIRGQVRNIEIAASISVGEITSVENKPLTVQGNALGCFILVRIDVSGEALGLAPYAVRTGGFIEVLIKIVDSSGKNEGIAIQADSGVIFQFRCIDTISQVLGLEFIIAGRMGCGIIKGKTITSLPVFAGFPAGLIQVGDGEEYIYCVQAFFTISYAGKVYGIRQVVVYEVKAIDSFCFFLVSDGFRIIFHLP